MGLASHKSTLNYREIITCFFLAGLALQGLLLLHILVVYAMPQPTYANVGALSDFPPRSQPYLVRDTAGPDFWLVSLGLEIRAFKPVSPDNWHCRFTWADYSQRFEDPCSGSKFALDGQYMDGPAFRNLDQYPLTIQGEQILVDLSRVILGEVIEQRLYRRSGTTCGYRVYYTVPTPGATWPVLSETHPLSTTAAPGKQLVKEPVYCP